MRLEKVIAQKEKLVFVIPEAKDGDMVHIRECVPFLGTAQENVKDQEVPVKDGRAAAERYAEGRDMLAQEFEIRVNGEKADGVRHVTDFEGASCWEYPYPQPETKKTLGVSGEDQKILGIKQTLININLPAIMAVNPDRETIKFECQGKTYHFLKDKVDKIDEFMEESHSNGLLVTAILLNSPRLFESEGEKELLDKVIHPGFDWDCSETFISAFNMEQKEGQDYYRAFIEFLASRYSREDGRYGRMCGFIISNEVDSQYIWGNAGEMPVEQYVREYEAALRLAWLSARKYYSNFRVYVSLDHMWTRTYRVTEPLRYYRGRDVIDYLNKYSKENGDFDWGVAYHPYPENLMYPDFYNDRSAVFDYGTERITFKNIEMLPAYLSQEQFLCKGRERRIILSEQGFNSRNEDPYTLKQGAASYCLAYQKVKKLPTIDMITHHAYVDNRYEFGLNLGIRRLNDDDTPGEPKPIYYVMRDMDTPQEAQRVEEAREFIGKELFDSLLNPVITYGDADRSKESEFMQSAEE